MSMLYEKDRYVAPYDYLINCRIREYDITKANISILLTENLITKKQHDYLLSLPKMQREIKVGLMMRDNHDLSVGLSRGLVEARKAFLTSNNIEDRRVLYIDKDSITIIDEGSNMMKGGNIMTKFGENINFRLTSEYSSFFRLLNVDFLYGNNISNTSRVDYETETETFRIKNASKNVPSLHRKAMLDLLLNIAYCAQVSRIPNTLQMLKETYCKYIGGELPLDFYREFNQRSQFKFKNANSIFDYYTDAPPSDFNVIDISYNAYIIRLFFKYLSNEYFKQAR